VVEETEVERRVVEDTEVDEIGVDDTVFGLDIVCGCIGMTKASIIANAKAIDNIAGNDLNIIID